MSDVENRTIEPEAEGQRLDRWFKRHYPELRFGELARLLRTGQIRLDGRRAKPATRVESGQQVRVPPLSAVKPAPAPSKAEPAPNPETAARLLERVLFRDDWVIALDKPAGLATQGGSGVKHHVDGQLDALRFGADERPRLVHRLDRDTSGVLLLGRGAEAARALTRAFRDKSTEKIYWALVVGNPKPKRGRIELPLSKLSGPGGEKMALDSEEGQEAITLYARVAGPVKGVSWLALSPLTGRTHQLRAHMAAIGAPILGDGKYGGRAAFLRGFEGVGLQLHARQIALPHPQDGTTLRVTAPLPEHIAATFKRLGFVPERGEDLRPMEN